MRNLFYRKFAITLLTILVLESAFCGSVSFAKSKAKEKSKTAKAKKMKQEDLRSKPVPFNQMQQKPRPFIFPSSTENKQMPTARDEKVGLTVGIKAGGSAGLTGAVGDVSYSLSQLVPGASIRGGIGYLTGSSGKIVSAVDDIKLAMVNLDAVYNLENLLSSDSPFKVYLGGGVIYPLKVNKNRGAGAWGAHAYFGSRYLLQKDTSIYGELAYTGIKYQADEAALRGIEAMLGYSYSF